MSEGNLSPVNFYQAHLDRVSRSFSFCISILEGPLRAWVSLTYLVCRILDTVEDAPWAKQDSQLHQFDRFEDLLKDPQAVKDLEVWRAQFPAGLSEGEKSLISDSGRIFNDFHNVPHRVKKVISDMVLSMSAGMRYFTEQKSGAHLKLENLTQVNQYCFFVAGVVGETLTRLIHLESEKSQGPSLVDAHHFGLFLQKVNLLKDQQTDESQGRFFIPSRELVFKSLKKNAHGAFRYIEYLPVEKRDYRLFCAYSFFLGLASLPYFEKAFQTGKSHKISRIETFNLLNRIKSVIDEPEKLRVLYEDLLQKSGLADQSDVPEKQDNQSLDWFLKAYKGEMTQDHMRELGLTAG